MTARPCHQCGSRPRYVPPSGKADSYCRECRYARNAVWKSANLGRAYAASAAWKELNREHYEAVHAAASADWLRRNPKRAVASSRRRRERAAGVQITVRLTGSAACYLCGKPLAAPVEWDHEPPLADLPEWCEVRPVHRLCNRRKGARAGWREPIGLRFDEASPLGS